MIFGGKAEFGNWVGFGEAINEEGGCMGVGEVLMMFGGLVKTLEEGGDTVA